MSDAKSVEVLPGNIFENVLNAAHTEESSQLKPLLKIFTEKALEGTIQWDKNLVKTITAAIEAIDSLLSRQLSVIMHQASWSSLEGSWRGLRHLIMQSETGSSLKIKMIPLKKKELFKDLDKAVEFDQSCMFKKIYEDEYGSPGGEPYGLLVGDYCFTHHPEDIDTLNAMAGIAAAAFCPFITAPHEKLFGFESWVELSKPRDLAKNFESAAYTKWRSFRETEDARFVNLVLPRSLARLPYGASTCPVESFGFEETLLYPDGSTQKMRHEEYCWMNSAYVMAANITHAFAKYNWCTAIRGAEGGGKVSQLPLHIFKSKEGDLAIKCPTESAITDRREAELSRLGFLPISHYKNTDMAVFFGGQSAQQPKKYDNHSATENANISARLPYIMASSRFAHYLKIIARDKMGAFMECKDVEDYLNRWINQYVNANENIGPSVKAKYPLAEAKIQVKPIPGEPGAYHAIAWLRPWLQLEALTTSLRMVARIPQLA